MEDIKTFMTKDHKRLNKLLLSLEKTPSEKNFKNFKTNIKNHFKIEEKYIFRAFITANEIYDIFKLIDEHKEMINLINEIKKNLHGDFSEKIKELKKINSVHIKYEDEFLYPKLENILANNHKKELLLKIKKTRKQ